ncbi:tigger transposable element-derived protein 6-like [Bacillus rossius redtenbacheri]|uniref:tigger transposable element-derived protein 6-like n=1 Tax=Bacillus rossius redtenbacheri TaxID=93214 RepID=UPI002FDCD856
MLAKADELALKLGLTDFKRSVGWLNRFKARHGISSHKIVGESASVDPKSVSEWLPLLQNILSRYQPRDVYNADELGMFYNLLPDRTLAVKGDVCKGAKRSKERLTALLCCNMDGSDKMKPLVIGKSKKPRGFKGNILHCDYDFNKKAWMNAAVFTKWLRSFDAKMDVMNRKVVLFVDNCPAHPPLDNLRNIELVFLPKNTTSVLQPLDQGIIQQVKLKYREMLVRSMVLQHNIGKEIKKWDMYRATEAIVTSWRALKPEVIANCFRHANFVTPVDDVPLAVTNPENPDDTDDPPTVDAEPQPGPSTKPQHQIFTLPCDDELWQQLAPDCTFAEFVTADDNVAVWGTQDDDSDDVKGQEPSDEEEEEEEGEGEGEAEEPEVVPTTRDVLKAGDVYEYLLRRHAHLAPRDVSGRHPAQGDEW